MQGKPSISFYFIIILSSFYLIIIFVNILSVGIAASVLKAHPVVDSVDD